MSYYLAHTHLLVRLTSTFFSTFMDQKGALNMVKKTQKKSSTATKAKSKTTTKAQTKTKAKTTKPSLKSLKISKALTRTQQIAFIAEQAAISKKDVTAVIDCIEPMIASHLRGPGQITFAGLMKLIAVRKPATKARKGVNPFTGEPTVFKAKPARNVVKIRPLKKVKDLVV